MKPSMFVFKTLDLSVDLSRSISFFYDGAGVLRC